MLDLDSVVEVYWAFSYQYLLDTGSELYIWSSPSYLGGDNTVRKLNTTYPRSTKAWTSLYIEHLGVGFVRCKGRHIVRSYCGDQVKFLDS
jgi:hypothetical protein